VGSWEGGRERRAWGGSGNISKGKGGGENEKQPLCDKGRGVILGLEHLRKGGRGP